MKYYEVSLYCENGCEDDSHTLWIASERPIKLCKHSDLFNLHELSLSKRYTDNLESAGFDLLIE
jgi:hypothetical protein